MKKTENKPMPQRNHRFLPVFLVLLTVVSQMPVIAFANSTEITSMNTQIYNLYLLIRNDIAFPLLALSFASCGFKILGAGFTGSERGIQAAKEQLITSVCALLLILMLPYLITYGIRVFKAGAWTPSTVLPANLYGGPAL